MAFAHRDHAPGSPAGRPDHHDNLAVETAHRLKPRLAVVMAVILLRDLHTSENLTGMSEI